MSTSATSPSRGIISGQKPMAHAGRSRVSVSVTGANWQAFQRLRRFGFETSSLSGAKHFSVNGHQTRFEDVTLASRRQGGASMGSV